MFSASLLYEVEPLDGTNWPQCDANTLLFQQLPARQDKVWSSHCPAGRSSFHMKITKFLVYLGDNMGLQAWTPHRSPIFRYGEENLTHGNLSRISPYKLFHLNTNIGTHLLHNDNIVRLFHWFRISLSKKFSNRCQNEKSSATSGSMRLKLEVWYIAAWMTLLLQSFSKWARFSLNLFHYEMTCLWLELGFGHPINHIFILAGK